MTLFSNATRELFQAPNWAMVSSGHSICQILVHTHTSARETLLECGSQNSCILELIWGGSVWAFTHWTHMRRQCVSFLHIELIWGGSVWAFYTLNSYEEAVCQLLHIKTCICIWTQLVKIWYVEDRTFNVKCVHFWTEVLQSKFNGSITEDKKYQIIIVEVGRNST